MYFIQPLVILTIELNGKLAQSSVNGLHERDDLRTSTEKMIVSSKMKPGNGTYFSLRKPNVFALQILRCYLTKEGRVRKFFYCLYPHLSFPILNGQAVLTCLGLENSSPDRVAFHFQRQIIIIRIERGKLSGRGRGNMNARPIRLKFIRIGIVSRYV